MRKLIILWTVLLVACSNEVTQVEPIIVTSVSPTPSPSSTLTPTYFLNYKGTPVGDKATLSALVEGTKDSKWYTTEELDLTGKYWIVIDYYLDEYYAMDEDEARELLGSTIHIEDGVIEFREKTCEFEKLEVEVVTRGEYWRIHRYNIDLDVLAEIGLGGENWTIIQNWMFAQCPELPKWTIHILEESNIVLHLGNTFFVLEQWQPGQATPTAILRPTLTPTPLTICVPDPDFEYRNSLREFYPALRSAILDGDKEFIVDLVDYPITVAIADEQVEISTKEEFLSSYDEIMSEWITSGAENTSAEELFVNWKGAMIAQGGLWFNVFQLPEECLYEFRITGINN